MIERFEIQGGAGEYEAAVLSAVMEQMRRRNRAARARRPHTNRQLSAWVRASRLTALDTLPVPDPGLNGNIAPTKPSEQPWLQPSLRRGIMR